MTTKEFIAEFDVLLNTKSEPEKVEKCVALILYCVLYFCLLFCTAVGIAISAKISVWFAPLVMIVLSKIGHVWWQKFGYAGLLRRLE